ncbi:FAD-dependent monooxygenase [Dictyobacter aurantiacus]|uniref:FAD-binding monooxygenase n=1 Tax=Dictyobacter aurantiacus TaxID=1936993 RepID=A0A401ZTG0_9CHLR|nr:FAD-dependent monooxygenase [Dictyobacter aurantiacus]GCE10070.1 FAD-binding monooxygenase [Dictyobacter aurantiacus]
MTQNDSRAQEQVPVLIVGAGGAGLSLSLLLLQQGIRPLLIERRDAISVYPRARNLNFRTLEVLRGLGLETEVREAGARISQVITKETLASEQEQIFDPTSLMERVDTLSPDPFGWHCPQSRLEPVLLEASRKRGGDVRYHTELVSFAQDDSGVTATLQNRATGRFSVVRSDYLIAADGAHSRIRETLGIASQGMGVLPEHFIFVYFRAPWQELIAGREADGFVIKNADVQGIFLLAKDDLGMFMITYRPALGEAMQDFTAEHCKDLVQKALGTPEMPVEIVDIAPWQPAESVATHFQQGRVFLVGDAAHTMPAYKGLGVNTAIQSAQNLGWKLAAVLRREAPPALLETYQQERHPVGCLAARQSLTGPGAAWLAEGIKSELLPVEKELPLFYPIVGYRYRSQAILAEDAVPPVPEEIMLLEREELTGLPGTRVPHLWLERQGQRISTLDLLDGHFIFLTGAGGAAWCEAAKTVAQAQGIALSAYRLGPDADLLDEENAGPTKLGISSTGAMLVRPDGFVAWRSSTMSMNPVHQLEQVLSHILCRPPALRESNMRQI